MKDIPVLPVCFLLLLLVLSLASCQQIKQPIKIGLSINLSGRGGDAGEEIRDGALLAVEELNTAGGINGHPLQLLIRDDRNSDAGIQEADTSLIKEGVMAIIGHSNSANTVRAYPLVTGHKTLLITAYTATTKLSGQDDLFLRTAVDCALYGKKTAMLLKKVGSQSISFLMDMSNRAFVLDYVAHVKKHFPGQIREVRFQSRSKADWSRIIRELLENRPDSIVLLTEASMTGIALQKLEMEGFKGNRIATLWTQTPSLMRYAGKSAEGLKIVSFIDPDNNRPAYRRFSDNLQKRFGQKATARSSRSFELMMILADGLKRCNSFDSEALKQALLAGTYETLLGSVRFDQYGDVIRPVYELIVRNQQFHNNGEL